MSRIGKSPIPLAQGVEINVANGIVTVKGPKGTLTQEIDNSVNIEIQENEVIVTRINDQKDVRAKHGLYRSLLFNMIVGVSTGWKKRVGNDRGRISCEYGRSEIEYDFRI